jgi:hypothetical protein
MNPCFSSFILIKKNLCQENHDRNHNHWNTVSTEKDILHIQVLLQCIHRINWERYIPYTGPAAMYPPYQLRKIYSIYRCCAMYPPYQLRKIYSIYRCCCNVSTCKDILHIQVLLQCIHRINWERYTPYTGAAAMYTHVNGNILQWENWNYLPCRKVSFSTCSQCKCICVGDTSGKGTA